MTDGHYIMGKMWWLLRRPGGEALPVTMCGVRAGDRVLQIGVDDPAIVAGVARSVGLNGEAAIVVEDERAADLARAACAEAGALADIQVAPLDALPHPDTSFDVVVIHGAGGWLASMDDQARTRMLGEARRVLRAGGRAVVTEPGTKTGLASVFRAAPRANPAYEAAGGSVGALESAGFHPVRLLADREGTRFVEGLAGRAG